MEGNIYRKWDSILNEFKIHYFRIADKVVDWYPSGRNEIIVILDDGRRLIFDWLSKRCYDIDQSSSSDYIEDETDWINNFSNRLHSKMINSCYTQERLASETGISIVTINKYVKGKSIPNSYNLSKIARALKCSVCELTSTPID